MEEIKMNYFEHYNTADCIPIENNISRIFARILNDNLFVFDKFIEIADKKLLNKNSEINYLSQNATDYRVGYQKFVNEIDIENYNQILGIALTAEEIKDMQYDGILQKNENFKTDIIIEGYKDILIVIEVKRTTENCTKQLLEQIQSIKLGYNHINFDVISFNWSEIVEIFERYIRMSKIPDYISLDFYEYLKNHFPNWFPVRSFKNCEKNIELLNKRIDRLVSNIQEFSKSKQLLTKREWNVLETPNWKWAAMMRFEINNQNMIIKLWEGDIKNQIINLLELSDFKFIIDEYPTFYIKELSTEVKVEVKPYLKIYDTFGHGRYWGYINKDKFKSKSDYENIIKKLYKMWKANENNEYVFENLNLIKELEQLDIIEKDSLINYIEQSSRKQLNVAFAFETSLSFKLKDLEKNDLNFNVGKNIDELAEPIYNFILRYKNIVDGKES